MRITANQVTMMRIILLPLPVYMLIYGATVSWWIAFFIFALLGATDFIDGVMARKEGPTTLGSLLDPVADKIFIAAIVLSMVAIGVFPGWVASALISRELLMTALRSSAAMREEQIKTSKLAKMKTIVQMGGLGTIFFSVALPKYVTIICGLLSLPFLVVALAYWFRSKRAPFWAFPVFAALFSLAVVAYFFAGPTALWYQIIIIISITWISALDYIIGSYRLFLKSGIFIGDWLRIIWAVVFGLFVAPLVAYFPIMVLPLLVSIALELALGGIDNIVVAQKKLFTKLPFAFSICFGLSFALFVNFAIMKQWLINPFIYSFMLACASATICGAFFGKHAILFKRI